MHYLNDMLLLFEWYTALRKKWAVVYITSSRKRFYVLPFTFSRKKCFLYLIQGAAKRHARIRPFHFFCEILMNFWFFWEIFGFFVKFLWFFGFFRILGLDFLNFWVFELEGCEIMIFLQNVKFCENHEIFVFFRV